MDGELMRYLIPLGAIGVLYAADSADTHNAWGQLVTLAAVAMFVLSLILAIGGNQKNGH